MVSMSRLAAMFLLTAGVQVLEVQAPCAISSHNSPWLCIVRDRLNVVSRCTQSLSSMNRVFVSKARRYVNNNSYGRTWIMCMKARLNIMPKTTELNRIVGTGKSKAEVTNNKKLHVLLKLTTDRHEASRCLFATAELLVTWISCCLWMQPESDHYL